MKIWYQSFTNPDIYGAYLKALVEHIGTLCEPGLQVDVHPLRTGGMGSQHHYLEHLQVDEVLENVELAVEQGYDAFAIGHFTDAGLQAAREIAPIPVLGLGENSMLTACSMGRQSALVGINAKSAAYISRQIRDYGFESRITKSALMHCHDPRRLEEAFHDEEARDTILAAFNAAADDTVSQGAEVVIAAGGIVMLLAARAGLHSTAHGAVILDGIASLVYGCQAAVRLRRAMGGQFTSRSLSYAPPAAAELPAIRRHYGRNIYRHVDETK